MDQDDGCMDLPPGYRFHPMDEEIITHYLWEKVVDNGFTARAIGEVDLNKCEPWDLPSKAKMGENEWYFFCQRDRKYPTGMRTNRATKSGYWKATGKDKEIYKGRGNLVGMKKTLVFYMGRAPKGEKTNWVMHEYRLEGESSYPNPAKNEWVVCRVFHKSTGLKRTSGEEANLVARTNSFSFNSNFVDDLLESPTLPALMDTTSYLNNTCGNTSTNHNQVVNPQNFMDPSPNFYSQIPSQTPFAAFMGNMDFKLHQEMNSCKEEETSHQSSQVSASHDTCMQQMGYNQYYDDLECVWKT